MRTRFLLIVLLGVASAVPLEQIQNINIEEIKHALLNAVPLEQMQNVNIEEIKHALLNAVPLEQIQNIDIEEIKHALLTAEEGSRVYIVESVVNEILEQLRQLMVSGSENFPILDPILVESINIDGAAINLPGSYVRINDMLIRDLSTFQMENFQFTTVPIIRFRADFDVVIPVVSVNTSSYDMQINIFGGEVFGKGDMSLRIINPRVKGHLILGLRVTLNGTFLHIHECRINIGLDDFIPVITGMFDSESSSEFVSAFLRNLIRELLDFFEDDITDTISGLVIFIGNTILGNFDIGDLLPLGDMKDFENV